MHVLGLINVNRFNGNKYRAAHTKHLELLWLNFINSHQSSLIFKCEWKTIKGSANKLKFSDPYIFATWWYTPLIFQALPIWSNKIHSLF